MQYLKAAQCDMQSQQLAIKLWFQQLSFATRPEDNRRAMLHVDKVSKISPAQSIQPSYSPKAFCSPAGNLCRHFAVLSDGYAGNERTKAVLCIQ